MFSESYIYVPGGGMRAHCKSARGTGTRKASHEATLSHLWRKRTAAHAAAVVGGCVPLVVGRMCAGANDTDSKRLSVGQTNATGRPGRVREVA